AKLQSRFAHTCQVDLSDTRHSSARAHKRRETVQIDWIAGVSTRASTLANRITQTDFEPDGRRQANVPRRIRLLLTEHRKHHHRRIGEIVADGCNDFHVVPDKPRINQELLRDAGWPLLGQSTKPEDICSKPRGGSPGKNFLR